MNKIYLKYACYVPKIHIKINYSQYVNKIYPNYYFYMPLIHIRTEIYLKHILCDLKYVF